MSIFQILQFKTILQSNFKKHKIHFQNNYKINIDLLKKYSKDVTFDSLHTHHTQH